MKKAAFILLSVVAFGPSLAQQTVFGVKGGMNISNLQYSDQSSTNKRIGLHLGILAQIHAAAKWAIEPEFFYSLEGNSAILIPQGTVYTKLNYLAIPVLVQYLLNRGFLLESGPQIAYLLSASTKQRATRLTDSHFQSTAISLPLGVGYQGTSGFGLDARYCFGLTNINNGRQPIIQGIVLQLGAFYSFSVARARRTRKQ